MNEQLQTTVIDRGAGTAIALLQERVQTILEVMANVLDEGKDYGRIPGTDKPTLYKPGAEKLNITFNLTPGEPKVDDLSTSDEIRYRVGVPIESADGRVRWGIGEASSNEEKYRWRKPVCDEEWEETPEHLRREKWFKGFAGKPAFKGKQIRTSPADVANTVLKMAHKRGFIHGTLMATGASSVFNQDLEDFSKELQDSIIDADPTAAAAMPKPAQRKSEKTAAVASTGPVTDARKVKDVRVFGKDKNNHAVILDGDTNEYTTKDEKVAAELTKFKGTDHLVRIRFEDNEWNGKTYHNIKSWAVDEAAPATPAPEAASETEGVIVDVVERESGSLIKFESGFQCATADAELTKVAKDAKDSHARVAFVTQAPRNPKYARRLVELTIIREPVTA